MINTIPVAEVFGPTIQGEGALAGRSTYFVRVGGCDYACSWCDSGHAVLAESVRGLPRLTQEQIIGELRKLPAGPDWLTISGGNPALYNLEDLTLYWHARRGKVAVETQGSKWSSWFSLVDLLTLSPKGPSSGLSAAESIKNFEAFTNRYSEATQALRTVLKVVVFDEADYAFAVWLHQAYPWWQMFLSCGTAMGGLDGSFMPPKVHPVDWSMPVDTEVSLLDRYRWLADQVKTDHVMADVAVLPQLHVLTWGHQRGV